MAENLRLEAIKWRSPAASRDEFGLQVIQETGAQFGRPPDLAGIALNQTCDAVLFAGAHQFRCTSPVRCTNMASEKPALSRSAFSMNSNRIHRLQAAFRHFAAASFLTHHVLQWIRRLLIAADATRLLSACHGRRRRQRGSRRIASSSDCGGNADQVLRIGRNLVLLVAVTVEQGLAGRPE